MDFRLSKAASLLIDLVRGSAAQAVVVGHALSFFSVAQIPYLQNSGVAVFFVLSGIVVPYSTFQKRSQDPDYSIGSYLVDRFSRIYTGLVPALVFVAALDLVNRGLFGAAYRYSGAFDTRTFIGNLLMLQDHPLQTALIRVVADRLGLSFTWIEPVTSFGSARPLWTVAIEWWIYLLFGWVALGGVVRRTRPVLFWFCFWVLLLVPASNWVVEGRGRGLTLTWGLGLLILALLVRLPGGWFQRDAAFLASLFLMASVGRLLLTKQAYDALFVALFATSLYFALCHLQYGEGLAIPGPLVSAIRFNSSFSYSLYLVHYSVLDLLVNWRGPGRGNAALGFILSNVLAIGLYGIFEKRYRALRAHLRRVLRLSHASV